MSFVLVLLPGIWRNWWRKKRDETVGVGGMRGEILGRIWMMWEVRGVVEELREEKVRGTEKGNRIRYTKRTER